MRSTAHPFHLSIWVTDLDRSTEFYVKILNCSVKKVDFGWKNFDFFGNQLTLHEKKDYQALNHPIKNDVPLPHFGAIIPWDRLMEILTKLLKMSTNIIFDEIQNVGTESERRKLAFEDPSGNIIELKSYKIDNV